MVVRDHTGLFLEVKVLYLPCLATVFEVECIGVRETLSWVIQRGEVNVIFESDSLLTVNAVQGKKEYLVEVVHVVDHCKRLLHTIPGSKIIHIRKQANRVAHRLAQVPCSTNCFHIFTSPASYLLETIMKDYPNE